MTRRRTPLPLLAGVLLAVGLAACSASEAAIPPTSDTVATADTAEAAPGVRVVSPDEAHELLADPDVRVLDVRTPEEFADGHLEGAQLIDINAPDFADRVAELDREATWVLYCRSGNRSAAAREVMSDLGFLDVADVDGGIVAWQAAGLPVTTG